MNEIVPFERQWSTQNLGGRVGKEVAEAQVRASSFAVRIGSQPCQIGDALVYGNSFDPGFLDELGWQLRPCPEHKMRFVSRNGGYTRARIERDPPREIVRFRFAPQDRDKRRRLDHHLCARALAPRDAHCARFEITEHLAGAFFAVRERWIAFPGDSRASPADLLKAAQPVLGRLSPLQPMSFFSQQAPDHLGLALAASRGQFISGPRNLGIVDYKGIYPVGVLLGSEGGLWRPITKIARWSNLPEGLRQHLIDRMRDRAISIVDLNQLRVWIEAQRLRAGGRLVQRLWFIQYLRTTVLMRSWAPM